ncbi:unnamed protein product [Owenia fusiformis]|uniref:Snurportin-1 n=1 Tax=Owenia fusiformis TaxID=6347 RepID=A0A8J1XV16_OWEFU|nr:unnamed protein product [Owenia fusiformis]
MSTPEKNALTPDQLRISQYKAKYSKSSQDERRKSILERQKEKRFNYQSHARRLADSDWSTADDDEYEDDGAEEAMETVSEPVNKPGRYYSNQLMFSEWMVAVPENFDKEWLMVMSPVGKRVLLIASKGITRAYGKTGYKLNEFASAIPGGSMSQQGRGSHEYSVLDCVWSEALQTYFIIDMMCWKSHPIYDTETEFRFFWMHQKFTEDCPNISKLTRANQFHIVPLPHFACSRESLQVTMEQAAPDFKVDGLLFYHKKSHYAFGSTPLVTWLKPWMLPEVLNIPVPEKYMKLKPPQYNTAGEFIDNFNKKEEEARVKREERLRIAAEKKAKRMEIENYDHTKTVESPVPLVPTVEGREIDVSGQQGGGGMRMQYVGLVLVVVGVGVILGAPAASESSSNEDIVDELRDASNSERMKDDFIAQEDGEDQERWRAILKMIEDEARRAKEFEEYGEEDPIDNEWPAPLSVVPSWPDQSIRGKLGQVSGVAVDNAGIVYVLHRGARKWEADMFDEKTNKFTKESDGPIAEATILKIDPQTGLQLDAWGQNIFYLPHGLSIDSENNLWVTDVATHQVYKFANGEKEPSLVIGTKFAPGNGTNNFCKPTDVAVAANGDFFVSDGYCNHRIVKFTKGGEFIKAWGQKAENDLTPGPYDLEVPHSLALVEEVDAICVADREHGRVQCYTAGIETPAALGKYNATFTDPRFGSVYALTFDVEDGLFYLVNGDTEDVRGFTINPEEGQILEIWSPDQTGFTTPHDVAVSPDGRSVYVGEIGPDRVWKFYRDIQ